MARVTVTFEDRDGTVNIQMEFDPPTGDNGPESPAQIMGALAVAKAVDAFETEGSREDDEMEES